jgi:hypothetical protein
MAPPDGPTTPISPSRWNTQPPRPEPVTPIPPTALGQEPAELLRPPSPSHQADEVGKGSGGFSGPLSWMDPKFRTPCVDHGPCLGGHLGAPPRWMA